MPLGMGKDYKVLVQLLLDDKEFNQKLKNTGESVKKVGRFMTTYLTTSILAAGGAIAKFSMDFEESMSKIVGLVGIAQEQVDEWGKQILKMSGEVGRAPRELADALYFITSAGIRGAEAMDVLEISAKAAASGLGETKTIADLITSVLNAYGKENITAAHATDILIAAVREGKAEAPEFASAMGKVLPISSSLGISFDQVAAAIAAMSRTGTDVAMGTTQLSQIFISLLKPTKEAKDQLDLMGTSARELRKSIVDEGLFEGLKKLTEMFGDNEEAQGLVFGNKRALLGIMDLFGKNIEDNERIFKNLTDTVGSLDKAFDAASQTMSFKFKKAWAELQAALIGFKDILYPVLEGLAKGLSNVSSWLSNLTEGQRRLIISTAAVVAALGPLLFLIGTLLTNLKTIVAFVITTVIPLLTGPLGIVLALGAVGSAAYFMWENFNKASNTYKDNILKDLKEVRAAAIETAGAITEASKQAVIELKSLHEIQTLAEYKKASDRLTLARQFTVGTFPSGEVMSAMKELIPWYKRLSQSAIDDILYEEEKSVESLRIKWRKAAEELEEAKGSEERKPFDLKTTEDIGKINELLKDWEIKLAEEKKILEVMKKHPEAYKDTGEFGLLADVLTIKSTESKIKTLENDIALANKRLSELGTGGGGTGITGSGGKKELSADIIQAFIKQNITPELQLSPAIKTGSIYEAFKEFSDLKFENIEELNIKWKEFLDYIKEEEINYKNDLEAYNQGYYEEQRNRKWQINEVLLALESEYSDKIIKEIKKREEDLYQARVDAFDALMLYIDNLAESYREEWEKKIEKIEKTHVFQDTVLSAIDSIYQNLKKEAIALSSGEAFDFKLDALRSTFSLISGFIDGTINKVQAGLTAAGAGIGYLVTGSAAGAEVGATIGNFIGGFFAKKKSPGENAATPMYSYIVNWEEFYKLGFSLPSSYVYSGRSRGYNVDPHGRSLAISYEGWQTGQHYLP